MKYGKKPKTFYVKELPGELEKAEKILSNVCLSFFLGIFVHTTRFAMKGSPMVF
jgi:hypothetical protein